MKLASLFSILLISIVLSACGGGGGGSSPKAVATASPSPAPSPSPTITPTSNPTSSPQPNGALVYMDAQPNGNSFACAHCHALNEPDNFYRPGHPIADAPRRAMFKNGQLDSLVDAVNTCLDTWMGVPDPWTENTPEFTQLVSYLEANDNGSGPADLLQYAKHDALEFANNAAANGDAEAGRTFFNVSCAICHGNDAAGTNAGLSLQGRLQYEGAANFIASKVRYSGPSSDPLYPGQSAGGRMPFWVEDRISDANLTNVIEFLMSSDFNNLPNPGGGNTGGTRQCANTHAKVGQSAQLTTHAHGVAGTATIVDDCTITVTGFNFDGGGIDVRAYGGIGSTFLGGFSMGSNLVRNTPYVNDTATFQLPEAYDLDDLDRFSIWCVPVGVSFGDGVFQ